MENTCRLVHITYRENNRGSGREQYNECQPIEIHMYRLTHMSRSVFKEVVTNYIFQNIMKIRQNVGLNPLIGVHTTFKMCPPCITLDAAFFL